MAADVVSSTPCEQFMLGTTYDLRGILNITSMRGQPVFSSVANGTRAACEPF
jgi:hypothetical protein